MAEWYDLIVAFLKDWALVIATVALAVSTFFLAKYTKAMAKQTKATEDLTRVSIKASEALQTMPSLTINSVQPLSDSGGAHSRFSVKNVGYGHAKNPFARVKVNDEREGEVHAHSTTNMIEVDNLFYWDIFGVKVGDIVSIEISFTDIRDVPYPTFKHGYVVK